MTKYSALGEEARTGLPVNAAVVHGRIHGARRGRRLKRAELQWDRRVGCLGAYYLVSIHTFEAGAGRV